MSLLTALTVALDLPQMIPSAQNKLVISLLLLLALSCGNDDVAPLTRGPTVAFADTPKVGVLYDGSDIQKQAAMLAIKKARLEAGSAILITATTPEETKQGVEQLLAQDVHVIIGGDTLENAIQALRSVQDKVAVIISPSATESILSLHSEQLVRLPPPDNDQAIALADQLKKDGITCLLCFASRDAYGFSMQRELHKQFADTDIIKQYLFFDPTDPSFKTALEEIAKEIQNCENPFQTVSQEVSGEQPKKPSIAFQVSAQGPLLAMILQEASQIPGFENVRVYGSDLAVGSPVLLQAMAQNPEATPEANAAAAALASFVKKVDLKAPIMALPSSSTDAKIAIEELVCELKGKKPGEPLKPGDSPKPGGEPTSVSVYNLNFFDAVHLGGKIAQQTAGQSLCLDDLTTSVTQTASATVGVTGALALDDSNKRKAAAFDFYTISSDPQAPAWTVVGQDPILCYDQ